MITGLRNLIYSIRIRLTLWYVVLLAMVLTLFSGALYLALSITLHDHLDDALSSSATLLASALEVDAQGHLIAGPGQLTPWMDPDDLGSEGDYFWRVVTPSGQVMDSSSSYGMGDPTLDPAAIQAALDGREVVQTVGAEENPMRMYTVPVYQGEQVIGIVQLGLSADEIYETLTAFRWIAIVALPATLLIASAGGLFLASRAFDPVDQITRAAQSIGARDLSQRLDLDLPDDELGRLARTFDAMIARLDDAFWHQRRFVADASHELRTPLTIIKGDLSLTLARPRDADHYHQVLTEIDEEVDHMNRLVKRLLILARADAEGLTLHRQTVDLSVLLADLIEQTRPLAEAKGLTLEAQIAHDLTASVDPDGVTQVVLNLLDNAIKYTPSGQVWMNAHHTGDDDGEIQIAVSDSGIGIPAEHLPRIFERFYRVDQARSRELGGAGLGLAIARRLARAHGGDVVVHSVPDKGSTFTVRLPVE